MPAVAACALLWALVAGGAQAAAANAVVNVGESIYRQGLNSQGSPVKATRGADADVQGQAAACANCHQRSGLGGREGRILIPPITARYLFRPLSSVQEDRDIPFVAGMHADREPYTDATLARAISDGVDSAGKPLSFLMPRYDLGQDDMAALVAHLKELDRRNVPGVSATTLHFATIITPDADPVKRRGMLAVMNQFFADRNIRQMVPAPHLLTSGKTSYSGMMFKVQRRWELHVWELTGPEASWQDQLERHLAAEPVFAAISGLGGRTWAPIHAFCERAALPCLFPNVDAPPADAGRDFYSIYFSRGVLLEAELMGKSLLGEAGRAGVSNVLQVYRSGDIGEAAAAAMAGRLHASGVAVSQRVLPRDAPPGTVADVLRKEAGADAVVLWLRPGDLAALPPVPPAGSTVLLSGLMAGLERAPLPPAWRASVHMAYPVELPDRRRVRVDFALGWFRARHISLVADQTQIDTYLALGLLSEALKGMADTFVRDYLVEHLEDTLAHRIMTGYYPRLGMSVGQRYASKGGYLVRFAGSQGTALVADGPWTVP
jgi:cytochrome c553